MQYNVSVESGGACSPSSRPRLLTDEIGSFTSPNYPSNYYDGAECHWLIMATLDDPYGVRQLTLYPVKYYVTAPLENRVSECRWKFVDAPANKFAPTAVEHSVRFCDGGLRSMVLIPAYIPCTIPVFHVAWALYYAG